ncbi:MAG: c-type cytochrome [Alphaproteobacteria bacterium]|nr:c-type cytochrome [Alphaproteobacteria bacterium]
MSRSLVLALLLAACSAPAPEHQAAHVGAMPARTAEPAAPVEAPPAEAPAAPAANAPYVIDPAAFATLPEGPEGELVRRGHALSMDTHRLLPDEVGNGLNCTNCHLKAGTTPKAAPWVGVTDRYPRYRARSGKVDDLPDRINGCMERSMNGTALAKDSEPMQAFVAYMTWLSKDVPDGKNVADVGMPKIEPPHEPDRENGKALFETKCAACHGVDGKGVFAPDDATMFPPLIGERSYNIGAGMARLNTATAFVKHNMPLNQGGTLTDQEAHDIAAWFIFQDRPDLAKKDGDWPKGDKPSDARY